MSLQNSLQLLVSVRDEGEVADALAGGADWIDFKEPLAGPLGAVAVEMARRMSREVAGRSPISAALGELVEWPGSSAQELLEVPEVQVVKLGLHDCGKYQDWTAAWSNAFRIALANGKQLASVIYADWQSAHAPPPREVIACAAGSGCRYLLIDTWDKKIGSSIEVLAPRELVQILRSATQKKMTTVLAGNLQIENLSQIAELPVSLVAVRGAVCPGGRAARIDRTLVREFQMQLPLMRSDCKNVEQFSRVPGRDFA